MASTPVPELRDQDTRSKEPSPASQPQQVEQEQQQSEANPSAPAVDGHEAEQQLFPPPTSDESAQTSSTTTPEHKWPGWPGHNVFRLIVPVLKVGTIIGRKGELIKKMCEETRARISILEGPIGTADRIVLISGNEEPGAQLYPAMDAVLRVFKHVAGLTPTESDSTRWLVVGAVFCSVRLLVASSQAIHLIGKQGSTIKAIQENSSVSVRVLSEDEVPSYASSD